jgi:hypothetical protein
MTPTTTPMPVPISPDLLAFAQQTFDLEAFKREVQDIEKRGGKSFDEVIEQVEAVIRS